MRQLLRTLGLLLPLTLVSCGFFSKQTVIQGRDKHYLSAHSIPPTRVPPNLNAANFHNTYAVSDRNYPDSQKIVNILPPGLK